MLSTRKYFTVGIASLAGVSLLLSGCSTSGGKSDTEKSSESAIPTVSAKNKAFALKGLKPGQIPDIPSFEIPDISLMLASTDQFNIDAAKNIKEVPGVKVEPAKCDGTELSYDNGEIGGDGSASFWSAGKNVTNNGDGSGTYSKGGVEIQNNGDGSGTYYANNLSIDLDGKGGGTYTKGGVMINLGGDGSGTYSKGNGTIYIENNGDGS
jgi:OOP family OmpA-OmpF porin